MDTDINIQSNDTKMTEHMSALGRKFKNSDWLASEKILPQRELQLLDCLYTLGTGTWNPQIDYYCISEDLYLGVRHLFQKLFSLTPIVKEEKKIEKKKDKKKEQNKKEQIILENSKKIIEEEIKELMELFVKGKIYFAMNAIKSKYCEIRGLGFMYLCIYLENNQSNYFSMEKNIKKFKLNKIYEYLNILVSTEKFINTIKKPNFSGINIYKNNNDFISISTTFINDISIIYERVKNIFEYTPLIVYEFAPKLAVITDYDKGIPNCQIKPRQHHLELYNTIYNNFENGFLLSYSAMAGSGKTYGSIIIASIVQIFRTKNPSKYENIYLYFCCNVVSVRDQVARLCYNKQIPFAIASKDYKTGQIIIKNHNLCIGGKKPVVIIGSPMVIQEKLFETNDTESIIFLDEPTIGADVPNSSPLYDNVNLMMKCTRRTILSSATFPKLTQLDNIVQSFKDRYNDENPIITTIHSKDIQIGCEIKTYNGESVIPHLNVQNSTELKIVIESISSNGFLARPYTHNIVKTLYSKMCEFNIQNIPNISELFMNIENISVENVKKIALELLTILSQESDQVIKQVCETEIINHDENNIDFTQLGCSNAHQFNGMFLIASKNPLNFALENFSNLINDINEYDPDEEFKYTSITNKKSNNESDDDIKFGSDTEEEFIDENMNTEKASNNYRSIDRAIQVYRNKMILFEKQQSDIEKNRGLENNSDKKIYDMEKNKRGDGETSINKIKAKVTKDSRGNLIEKTREDDRILDKLEKLVAPKIYFPNFGRINTGEHYKKYASDKINPLTKFKEFIEIESLDLDYMEIDENIRTLLAAGVGIWSSEINCELYNKTVLELANDGKLSYLIVDKSICYGTNYPFDGVIIAQDFESDSSINTRFQTCSRTARPDKSWKGIVYISNNFAKEILDYVKNPDPINVEAVNMENMYNKIINDELKLAEKYVMEIEKELLEKEKAETKVIKPPTLQFISNKKKEPVVEPVKVNTEEQNSSNPYRRKRYSDQVKTERKPIETWARKPESYERRPTIETYKPLEVVRNKTADTDNNWRRRTDNDEEPRKYRPRPIARESESYRKVNFD